MGTVAPQITSPTIVYSTVYSDADQRHQSSALLALCAGNSPVPGEFPAQRPVTRSFDVVFDLRLNMFPFDDVIMLGEAYKGILTK